MQLQLEEDNIQINGINKYEEERERERGGGERQNRPMSYKLTKLKNLKVAFKILKLF